MAEVSRILTALGLAVASTGLIIYGIATSFYETPEGQMNLGLLLMVAGVIATVVGVVMSKRIPEED